MNASTPAGGWTVETLFQHVRDAMAAERCRVDQNIKALDRMTHQAMDYSQRAIDKADRAAEARFEGVNEFRGAMEDAASRLMPREAAEARFRALENSLRSLASRMDKTEGRTSGLSAGWLILLGTIGGFGGLLGILGFFFR